MPTNFLQNRGKSILKIDHFWSILARPLDDRENRPKNRPKMADFHSKPIEETAEKFKIFRRTASM